MMEREDSNQVAMMENVSGKLLKMCYLKKKPLTFKLSKILNYKNSNLRKLHHGRKHRFEMLDKAFMILYFIPVG